MSSSAGSDAFALLALLVIALFVLLLLRHFLPLRVTPAYLTVPVFLALALPLSIFLLVPIDLASSSRVPDESSRGIWLPDGVILVAWRLTYWLTFALTWFILPLLGEYADSGYRTPKDRIIYSLRSNGRYQLIMLLCAGAAAIYVFLVNGFKGGSVKSLVMALAYCWGLVMAIYLMGHGLVAIPRRLFRDAFPAKRLQRLYGQAPKVHDKMTDATNELEELEAQLTQLRRRKNAVSREHEEWIEDISEASNVPDSRLPAALHTTSPTLPAVITDRYLAEFSRKLMRARHKRSRFVEAWDRLVQAAVDTKAIEEASTSKRLEFTPVTRRTTFMTPYTRYLYHVKLIPAVRIFGGAILAILSICIVWSELIKFIAPRLSIISLTILSYRHGRAQVAFGGQVLAALWLLYMSIAALASFDDVKIWGNRALVRRNTYGESATWYSAQIAKLTVPLAYNFITFLPADVHKETQFFKFLGVLINLTPLGKYFDYFFPIFILVPVCATLFNLYGRFKRMFGFGIMEEDEETPSAFAIGGWRDGRSRIERELSTAVHPRPDGTSSPQPTGVRSPERRTPNDLTVRLGVTRQSTFAQRQAQRLAEATAAAEEENESFFQGFAHRVKNTLDNVERPEWINELGRRPKWMGRGDENNGETGRGDGGGGGGGLGRWLGGRSGDGRIRLQ